MTQEAVVTRLLPNGMAEVAVRRTTACGGNCGSCESCVFQNEMKTEARNPVEAGPGQKVLIESQSSKVFHAAFLVYVFPLLFFFLGYLLAALLGLDEAARIIASFLALGLGVLIVVLSQKKVRDEDRITFTIIEKL